MNALIAIQELKALQFEDIDEGIITQRTMSLSGNAFNYVPELQSLQIQGSYLRPVYINTGDFAIPIARTISLAIRELLYHEYEYMRGMSVSYSNYQVYIQTLLQTRDL